MNHKANFRQTMQQGGLSAADLPAWLQEAINCHDEAAKALADAPKARQAELLPILDGSDAVISAHIDRILRERGPTTKADKLKLMRIKAMAVELLLQKA